MMKTSCWYGPSWRDGSVTRRVNATSTYWWRQRWKQSKETWQTTICAYGPDSNDSRGLWSGGLPEPTVTVERRLRIGVCVSWHLTRVVWTMVYSRGWLHRIRVSRSPLSRSPSHCPRTLVIHIGLGLFMEFFFGMGSQDGAFFSPFDGWLTLTVCGTNVWKLFSAEVQDEYGIYNVILQSTRVRQVTGFGNGVYDFGFGVKNCSVQTTFSVRSAIVSFQRTSKVFFVYFDERPTAGAQVLARVLSIPWYPYHFGPALHCRVPSRSERYVFSKSDRHFFVVVEHDSSDLLSVELL